jgi:hypothetical protein
MLAAHQTLIAELRHGIWREVRSGSFTETLQVSAERTGTALHGEADLTVGGLQRSVVIPS